MACWWCRCYCQCWYLSNFTFHIIITQQTCRFIVAKCIALKCLHSGRNLLNRVNLANTRGQHIATYNVLEPTESRLLYCLIWHVHRPDENITFAVFVCYQLMQRDWFKDWVDYSIRRALADIAVVDNAVVIARVEHVPTCNSCTATSAYDKANVKSTIASSFTSIWLVLRLRHSCSHGCKYLPPTTSVSKSLTHISSSSSHSFMS